MQRMKLPGNEKMNCKPNFPICFLLAHRNLEVEILLWGVEFVFLKIMG
jgi:hypothetical protein